MSPNGRALQNPIKTIMTYFAPRQGLFAVIILVSMSLHLLFFVVSQDYTQSKQQQAIAQHKATLIAEEIATPLNAQDRVSVSVIANRHIKDNQVDFVGVYDSKDNLIVPVGKESPQSFVATETITLHNQVLGSVAVHTHAINRAEIISQNWAFLLAMFVLHIIIVLIYGYIARPSKNMLKKIADDVRLRLLSPDIYPTISSTLTPQTDDVITPISSTQQTNNTRQPAKTTFDISSLEQDKTHDDQTSPSDQQRNKHTKDNYMVVQISFDDVNNLMATVSHHTKVAYFSLCTQLLTKAVHELLKLPVVSGVSLFGIDDYSEQGATVTLKAENRHAKVAVAAMMLAKLMTMLNQIVYDKHRELKRFGLPVRATVSSIKHKDNVMQVAQKYKERVLILVEDSDLRELSTYSELDKLINPHTVSERQSRWLKAVSESTANRIATVRDIVLLSD